VVLSVVVVKVGETIITVEWLKLLSPPRIWMVIIKPNLVTAEPHINYSL